MEKAQMEKAQIRASKFLSLVLRHKPEEAGLSLDEAGWCSVHELLKGCASHGHTISRSELDVIVAENDKQRFEFSEDRRQIRARHRDHQPRGIRATNDPDQYSARSQEGAFRPRVFS